jgi:hypothetical protein
VLLSSYALCLSLSGRESRQIRDGKVQWRRRMDHLPRLVIMDREGGAQRFMAAHDLPSASR